MVLGVWVSEGLRWMWGFTPTNTVIRWGSVRGSPLPLCSRCVWLTDREMQGFSLGSRRRTGGACSVGVRQGYPKCSVDDRRFGRMLADTNRGRVGWHGICYARSFLYTSGARLRLRLSLNGGRAMGATVDNAMSLAVGVLLSYRITVKRDYC